MAGEALNLLPLTVNRIRWVTQLNIRDLIKPNDTLGIRKLSILVANFIN